MTLGEILHHCKTFGAYSITRENFTPLDDVLHQLLHDPPMHLGRETIGPRVRSGRYRDSAHDVTDDIR